MQLTNATANPRREQASRTPGVRYKRTYDLVVVLALLPIWAAACAIIFVSILAIDGRPVFYVQPRLGHCGRVFRIIKFRTMAKNAEQHTGPVWAAPNDPRVTRMGKILRPIGLDELPQIINILRGEMSLVGPRPERPELAAIFQRSVPGFHRRLAVPPGLTALSHVHGNSQTSPRHRLYYDDIYIRRMSPALDTYILAMTAAKIVGRLYPLRRCRKASQ